MKQVVHKLREAGIDDAGMNSNNSVQFTGRLKKDVDQAKAGETHNLVLSPMSHGDSRMMLYYAQPFGKNGAYKPNLYKVFDSVDQLLEYVENSN